MSACYQASPPAKLNTTTTTTTPQLQRHDRLGLAWPDSVHRAVNAAADHKQQQTPAALPLLTRAHRESPALSGLQGRGRWSLAVVVPVHSRRGGGSGGPSSG